MRLLDYSVTDKQDVRHLTEAQLTRLGIRVLKTQDLVLQCAKCGETWSP